MKRKGLAAVLCVSAWLVLATSGQAQSAAVSEDGDLQAGEMLEMEQRLQERFGADALDDLVRDGGVIGTVDFDGPTVTINGIRYDFTPDARVEIGGSFGAPTLLTPGLRARFAYRPGGLHAGSIVDLQELAPSDESFQPH
jgi:hypothetical protein